MDDVDVAIKFCTDLECNLEKEAENFLNEDQPGASIVIGVLSVTRAIRTTLEESLPKDE